MNPIQQNQLKKIAKDTESQGYGLLKQEQATKLGQYVEVNTGAGADANGLVQVRLNAAGAAVISAPIEPKVKRTFAVAVASGLPEKTRRAGGGHSVYPFEDLIAPNGDAFAYFDVLDTDVGNGDAYKAMSSTVSSANSRYATVTGEAHNADGSVKLGRGGHPVKEKTFTRKFEAFRIDGGVRIFRVQ